MWVLLSKIKNYADLSKNKIELKYKLIKVENQIKTFPGQNEFPVHWWSRMRPTEKQDNTQLPLKIKFIMLIK